MTITARLLLLIIPLVVLSLGCIGGFALFQLYNFSLDLRKIHEGAQEIARSAQQAKQKTRAAMSGGVNESLELYLNSLANKLDERIHGLERVMGSVVHNGSVILFVNGDTLMQNRLRDDLVGYFSGLVESQGLSEVSLLSSAGQELLRTQFLWAPTGKDPYFEGYPLPNVRTDESTTDWFKALKSQSSERIQRYVKFDENFDAKYPTSVISLTMKLDYVDFRYVPDYGDLKGYLRFVIPMKSLLPELSSDEWQSDFLIYLVDQQGLILLTNANEPKLGERFGTHEIADATLITKVLWEGQITFNLWVPNAYLEESIATVTELSNVVDQEISALEKFSKDTELKVKNMSSMLVAGCIAMVVLLVFALVLISTHITHPLRRLSQTTRRIRDGELSVPAQVLPRATREIVILAEGIDEMRERLRDQILTLDKRVKLKTEELSAYANRLEQEVEDRRVAERNAQEASKAKSAFLATMSHEIRTPMNGVITMSAQLIQTELGQDQQEMVDIIHCSGNHLLAIIDDILDYSKIEAGKMVLESVPINISEILKGLVNMVSNMAEQKGIQVDYVLTEAVPKYMLGDPVRMNQVLINLIGNAIKFTNEGEVVITVSYLEDFFEKDNSGAGLPAIRFEVRDTGIGIPAEKLEVLFDAFSQVDCSTTRQFGGTGLGLSITKRLIQLMQGEIKVSSELGKGSTFYASLPYLPLSESATAIVAEGSDKQQSLDFEKWVASNRSLRVLVAEDNQVNKKIAQILLSKLGVQAEFVDNGLDAVQRVKACDYDLVFMDCQMPIMDGFRATECIREMEMQKGKKRVSIVAMTANVMSEDKQMCLSVGMDDFIGKPINKKALLQVLSSVANRVSN